MKHETEKAILIRLAEVEELAEALRKGVAAILEHLNLPDPTDNTLTDARNPADDISQ